MIYGDKSPLDVSPVMGAAGPASAGHSGRKRALGKPGYGRFRVAPEDEGEGDDSRRLSKDVLKDGE